MSLFSLFVVYLLIWWVTLFAVLPFGVRGQAEEGGRAVERAAEQPAGRRGCDGQLRAVDARHAVGGQRRLHVGDDDGGAPFDRANARFVLTGGFVRARLDAAAVQRVPPVQQVRSVVAGARSGRSSGPREQVVRDAIAGGGTAFRAARHGPEEW